VSALNPIPLLEVDAYSLTIAHDPTDVYFPVVLPSDLAQRCPIVLLLQGALIDKADYSDYAAQVARYGFIVVVPNHDRTIAFPTGETLSGFLPEQQQIHDGLAQMVAEAQNPASPIAPLVDVDCLGLLGHSSGGYVGLSAIQNLCIPFICADSFTRPAALKAGIFYGTNFCNPPRVGTVPPITNEGIPIGLIAGNLDGVAEPTVTEETYRQIQHPPKILVTVAGANHYSITNADDPERDPHRPTLTQSSGIETIARWSALFLRAHLLNDAAAHTYLYQTGEAIDPLVSVKHAGI
jgi:hypothetical protein